MLLSFAHSCIFMAFKKLLHRKFISALKATPTFQVAREFCIALELLCWKNSTTYLVDINSLTCASISQALFPRSDTQPVHCKKNLLLLLNVGCLSFHVCHISDVLKLLLVLTLLSDCVGAYLCRSMNNGHQKQYGKPHQSAFSLLKMLILAAYLLWTFIKGLMLGLLAPFVFNPVSTKGLCLCAISIYCFENSILFHAAHTWPCAVYICIV